MTYKCIQHTRKENLLLLKDFVRTLKNKILKHMKAGSINFYFEDLDDIVDGYNNTFHKTIKMKPIDVKSGFYAEYNVDSNEKDPKFKVGDHVRISKCKKYFAKGYTANWSEDVFETSKIKNIVPQTYVIRDLNGEKIGATFYERVLQTTNQQKFRMEK